MISCDFDRRGCDHEALFVSEYKRTNRTKGTKILRCFPHCCPGHVNRSYCGSALHVRVQSHAAASKRARFTSDSDHRDDDHVPLDQLFVFAHFEEVGARTFAVGDELPSQSVFQSIQSEQHPKGEWIQGAPTDALDRETQLFQINPGARWYYEWESAATKAQRFTKHVLKVYVFRAAHGERLRIVAAVSSSQFMVVSYRRAPSEISGDRRILALLAENVARQSGELGLEPDNLIASLGQRMLPFLVDPAGQHTAHIKEDKTGTASPTSSWSPQQEKKEAVRVAPHRVRPGHPQNPLHDESLNELVESKDVWAARHQSELRMAKRLAVLAMFLSSVPAVDFQQELGAWGAMMGAPNAPYHAEAKSEEMATPPPFGGSVSWRFLSPLRLRHSPEHRSLPSLRDAGIPSSTSDASVSVLVSQCVEALAWALLDGSNRHLITQLLHEGSQALLSIPALRVVFIRAITHLHERIDRLLTMRFGTTLAQLHEDTVAVLFRVEAFRHTRQQLLRHLSSTSMAGFEVFVSMARQGFIAETCYDQKRKRHVEDLRPRDQTTSVFDGSWCFDSRQCSVVQLASINISNDARSPALSVAGAIEWMREFASVSIALDPSGDMLTLRSQWSLMEHGMALVLDGKKRVFDAFPSGVASAVPWNALAWGDYRAQFVGADCLMLEFAAWPLPTTEIEDDAASSDGVEMALRVKLCVRPAASQSSRSYALVVDGVLEHALCGTNADLSTLSIDHRRRAVDTWTPVYQLKAVYTPAAWAS